LSQAIAPEHVFRNATAGDEVVVLCNSAGTAIAVESEIPDAELVRMLRSHLAKES
jgi:hypothetical protein